LSDNILELREFRVLPYYSWEERPFHIPLELEEVRTALAISHGVISVAAGKLKVSIVRLNRFIDRSVEAQGLLRELRDAIIARASDEAVIALFDPNSDDRRREWGSVRVLGSRVAQGHAFSPAPSGGGNSAASVTLTDGTKRITFRWRSDDDDDAG